MKKTPTLTVIGMALVLASASGTILLNEIHITVPDPQATGTDANYEFIELRSTDNAVESCDGLTLLIIDNNGGQVGELKEALNLTGLSTGTNGLLMLGDDYDRLPTGGPWSGSKDTATTVADPSGVPPYSSMGTNDIGPNGGLTFLLVTGWTGLSAGVVDVDVDNNSVLDWTQTPTKPPGSQQTPPYTGVVDSVGFRDLTNTPVRQPYCPATADLTARPTSAPNFPPDSISRRLSRATSPTWANNSSAWYGANIGGTARDSVAYDVQWFGDFKGQATPGKPNLDAAPVAPNFLLNEVALNPAGTSDGNNEFVEIINTVSNSGSFAASLQGYALVLIGSNDGSGGTELGKILDAWDLSGSSTGANGLLLIGDDYPSGFSPWGTFLDPATQLADPQAPTTQNPIRYTNFGPGDLEDNNGFTLALVRGYSGVIGQDLDTNNDGILDAAPWLAAVDSIGFDQVGGTGKSYAAAKILTAPAYDPDLLARKLGNTTASTAAAWYGGDYGGNSPVTISLKNDAARPVFGGFKGAATPGRPNLAAAPAVADGIRINEVQIDPIAPADGSFEYVELLSTNSGIIGLNGLTLVMARATAGADNGKVLEAIDLSGLSTGPNGLVLIGDSYDNFSPYDVPQKLISPLTNREDPPGLDAGDIGPNEAIAILLVKGSIPAIDSNVSAIAAGDIVDSVATAAVANPTVAVVSTPFVPHNVSRDPGSPAPNSPTAWYAGQLDPLGGDASVNYGATYAGTYKGGASPGRYNHAATPNDTASVLLSEINLNPPGGDNDKEFIEYRSSSTSQAMSTNGYTLLLLDVDGAGTGTILEAWTLDGLATGANGLLLTGTGYTTSIPWTDAGAPAAATELGAPAGMDPDDIGGATNNGATSLLLVRYFTGKVGEDTDGGTPGGVADDGAMDYTPWSPLVDAVGVKFWDASLLPVAGLVGRVYGGVDLSQPNYTPDNLSRYQNVLTPLSGGAWYGADIAGTAATSLAFDTIQKFPAGPFIGRVTPGQPNLPTLTDDAADGDADGAPNLVEEALGMNPAVSDAHKLPTFGTVDVGGVLYPTLNFTRLDGGTTVDANNYSHNGLLYTVQFSTSLATWTNDAEFVSAGSASGTPPIEAAVYRPTSTGFAAGQTAGQMFLRLKVTRQ